MTSFVKGSISRNFEISDKRPATPAPARPAVAGIDMAGRLFRGDRDGASEAVALALGILGGVVMWMPLWWWVWGRLSKSGCFCMG
tara:strand:+ start:428 stop:682 length:255 start_codon:yes stop_codon:yes gene_type:complete